MLFVIQWESEEERTADQAAGRDGAWKVLWSPGVGQESVE
jgi:hypothetical protein